MNALSWMAACLAAATLIVQSPRALALEVSPSLEVRVDPRIELASLVASLTDWAQDAAEQQSSNYAQESVTTFGRYKKHLAIQECQDWLASGTGNLSLLMRLALTLSPDCKTETSLAPSLAAQVGGFDTAQRLTSQLVAFASDTSFTRYFQANRALYNRLEARIGRALSKSDPIRRVEAYYGAQQERYSVLLAPLAPKDRENLAIAAESTSPLAVMRPAAQTGDRQPDFTEDTPAFSREVCHAFGHAFLTKANLRSSAELAQTAQLFKPIQEDMRVAFCSTWPEAFEEHLLRAIDARFLQADGDGKQAQVELRSNERAGFAYVRDLFDHLATFEAKRQQYPTLDSFYPTFLAGLSYLCDTGAEQDVAKRYVSFQGPIARSLDSRFASTLVLVKPTPADPKLAAALATYVQTVQNLYRKRLRKTVKVLSPEEAAKLDPSKTAYLIFGTPWSNPFLSALMKYIPLKISKDTIQLGGRQFIGQNLRMITSFSNPYNPKLPITVFTGTEDKSIDGIYSLPYGPTDYAVYHDLKPIAQGDFVYDLRGRWSLP